MGASCRWCAAMARLLRLECPCAPPPTLKHAHLRMTLGVFVRKDVITQLEEIAREHPNGAIAELQHFLNCSRPELQGRPNFPAGAFADIRFDNMTKLAGLLLFGEGVPRLDAAPARRQTARKTTAEYRFHTYQRGACLDCRTLIEDAERADEQGRDAQRLLRALLAQFDLAGEPLPKTLREWSAGSRFEAPPKGKGGHPPENWFRDWCIMYTVAFLAYATSRPPTRNEATDDTSSPCDAVVAAFGAEGDLITLSAVINVWSRLKGQNRLTRWREAED